MGRTPCCQIREGLKKGPWTPEEDQKLIAFINQHGLGNWRALPKKCGLLRCGKSCRLRWTNYLRPDIKRGRFSDSEEQKIIQLHALLGNRWAFIASQLPKRTDNEIKNYWNTVLKKRLQKMGHIFTETHQDHKPSKTFSKSVSINVHTKLSMASSASICRHLAQWENARLEAEARIARESKLRARSSINCPSGFNFSSSANHPSNNCSSKQNNQYGLSYLSFNGHIQLNSIQDRVNHILLANCSTMSSSIFKNSSGSASTSCDRVDIGSSHKSSLSSQDSITSALELGPRGRSISWKTQELSLLKGGNNSILNSLQYLSKPSSNNELDQAHDAKVDNSQPSCNNKLDQAHDAKVDNSQQPRGDIMVNLIDTSLPLEDSDLQDLLFEIENSCFDLVSTWRSEKDEPTLRANETATM